MSFFNNSSYLISVPHVEKLVQSWNHNSWLSSQASFNKFLRHSKFTNKTVDCTSIAFFHMRNVTFDRLRFSRRIAGRFLLLFWRSHSFKQLHYQLPINCEISYNVIEGNCPHVSWSHLHHIFQARSGLFRPFSYSASMHLIDYIPCVCVVLLFSHVLICIRIFIMALWTCEVGITLIRL